MGAMILLLALLLFSILAFNRVSALILSPVVTIFILICFQMPIYESLRGPFMASSAEYVQKYFLVFFVGALFGALYQYTGAATAVALFIARFAKGRFVAPIIMIITGVLTYGGVSGFVVFFVIYPIALQLFRDANLSRVLIPASISAGTWTWSMSGPFSPSIQNVIPLENLETTSYAAPLASIIATVFEFAIIFAWLEWRSRKLSAKGKVFEDASLIPLDPDEMKTETKDLPNAILSFLPIVVILVLFNVNLKINLAYQKVEIAVMIGVILATVLFYKRIPSIRDWIDVFNKGAANSASAILNTAIVVGFAGVVKETEAFTQLIANLQSLNISPMFFVAITVAVSAGAAGSASGGMGVAFDALKDTYLALPISPSVVHRIAAISAGTLDTLPHQGAQITLLNICKLTHKDAYFDIAITQIICPFIALFVFMICASLGLA